MKTFYFKRVGGAAGCGGTAGVPGIKGLAIDFRGGFGSITVDGDKEEQLAAMVKTNRYPFGPNADMVEIRAEEMGGAPAPPVATHASMNSTNIKPKPQEPMPQDRIPAASWIGYQAALAETGLSPKAFKALVGDRKVSTREKEGGGYEYLVADLKKHAKKGS